MTSGTTALAVRVVPVVEAGAVATGWDDLAQQLGAAPYLRPKWVFAWHEAFGRGTLRLVVAERDGAMVGALPLCLRGPVAWSPTNWHTPVFGLLAAERWGGTDVAEALVDAALRRARLRLELGFVDAATSALVTRVAARRGRAARVAPVVASPRLTLAPSWQELEAGLSKNLRKDLRRRARRIAEQGMVRFEVDHDDERLADFLRVEGSGWKSDQGTAITDSPATRRFYSRVARWGSEQGLLRLMLLTLDGRVIAGDLAMRHGESLGTLKTGYDASLADLSPGKLLRREVVAHACEEGLETFEFLGADADWKRSWTTETVELDRVVVHGSGPAGRAAGRLETWLRPRVAGLVRRARALRGRGTAPGH